MLYHVLKWKTRKKNLYFKNILFLNKKFNINFYNFYQFLLVGYNLKVRNKSS